jgi:hypothetical protein
LSQAKVWPASLQLEPSRAPHPGGAPGAIGGASAGCVITASVSAAHPPPHASAIAIASSLIMAAGRCNPQAAARPAGSRVDSCGCPAGNAFAAAPRVHHGAPGES